MMARQAKALNNLSVPFYDSFGVTHNPQYDLPGNLVKEVLWIEDMSILSLKRLIFIANYKLLIQSLVKSTNRLTDQTVAVNTENQSKCLGFPRPTVGLSTQMTRSVPTCSNHIPLTFLRCPDTEAARQFQGCPEKHALLSLGSQSLYVAQTH